MGREGQTAWEGIACQGRAATQSTAVWIAAYVCAGQSWGGSGRRKALPGQQPHCHVARNTDCPSHCLQEG